jgi:hypothetical protein
MEDSQLAQWPVNRCPFEDEFVVPADIVKECRLRGITDRGLVQFHLYTSDPGQIIRVDLPFSPFTVALEEVTTTGDTNEIPERVGLSEDSLPIPSDRSDPALTEGSLYDVDVNVIQPDILLQQVWCDGFDRCYMAAHSGCADTKSADVSPDIKNKVIRE